MTTTDSTDVDTTDDAAEDVAETATPDEENDNAESSADEPEPDTFPRAVVEKLRQENGKYRQRAQAADDLAHRLHTELVRATGRLADPTDLPFDPEHLDDPEKLTAAVDALLDAKPHLATRRPSGDIGQGQRGPASGGFSLLDTLKGLT
ncbi:MAG: hypothetical protein R2742_16190 [Micropruina glycogenica]